MVVQQAERTGDSQSIARAVAVLRAIGERPGCSLGEIAKDTGLPRSTVQRLVSSLANEGLVTKVFGQQGVYLGMELARLAAKVNLDARTLLKPLMQQLHEKIEDNIDLTALEHGRVIVIEQIASNEEIRVISYVGKEHPINCTANGKAHLAMLEPAEAKRLIAERAQALTPRSIVDPDALMAQIDASRAADLYVDREEYGQDACAVATTLPPIGGRQLAISIAMPAARFARKEDEIKAALLEFREMVTRVLGKSI